VDIKRLLTRGGQVFAAEIIDGTEQYPVLLESLGNNVILPALIAEGWKLTALPLSLQKNGIALEDFPKMEFSPTVLEEQDMYDLLGTPLSMEERRAYLSDDVQKMELPQGNYTIQTREEFLQYLRKTADLAIPEDYLPINYFTHPSALFSLEEFQDPANKEYVALLEQRRCLSEAQFNNLREWALAHGLKSDFTPQDFVSFYFQWGVCGLNVPVLQKRTEERYVMKDMENEDPFGMRALGRVPTTCTPYLYDFGLVDRFQRLYRKPGTENYQIMEPKEAARLTQILQDNEVGVVRVRLQVGEQAEVWETTDTKIEFNSRYLMIGNTFYTSLRVQGRYGAIASTYWNKSMSEELNNEMFLHAIAHEFVERRRVKANVSSYKALCDSGCSPLAALIYMKDTLGLGEPDPLETEERTIVTTKDIQDYLLGNEIADDVQDIIEDMMNGVLNIDNIAEGIKADAYQNTDKLYSMLYCANHILGIPAKDIYAEVTRFDGTKPLSFTDGTVTLKIPSAPIDGAAQGYKADLYKYRKAQAKQATNYLWVDLVARELGPESATRPIGVKCYTATTCARLTAVLDGLRMIYAAKLESDVTDPYLRNAAKDHCDIFAVDAFFNGAMRGYYTFPDVVSKDVVWLEPETKALWRKLIAGPFVDDTVSIADNAIYYDTDGDWHWYCVNAVVQPYKIMPRKGYSIRETSLAAVWFDTTTLDIWPELVKRNLVRAGEMPWSYLAQQAPVFLGRTDLGLLDYYSLSKQAVEHYDRTKKFMGVPHLLELKYPALAPEDVELPPAGPDEDYRFKTGYGRFLQYVPMEVETAEEEHRSIYGFTGLTAEDYFYTGGVFEYPVSIGKKAISIIEGTGLYADGKIYSPADVEHMDPAVYPIKHLCGRKYLVCAADGAYWVVEV